MQDLVTALETFLQVMMAMVSLGLGYVLARTVFEVLFGSEYD